MPKSDKNPEQAHSEWIEHVLWTRLRLQLWGGVQKVSSMVWAHLHSLGTEDVLMQGRDEDIRQMVDVFFRFITTPLHATGHTLQRLC